MNKSSAESNRKDKTDFENLFKTYYPFLCSFARKYVEDVDDCKDIVHNVFLNLWQKQETLDTESSLKPYLFKSVHNRCLNYIRDRKKIIRHDLITDTQALPDYIESRDFLEESEMETKIKESIDALPDSCREVFMLSRFEDKKYKEIADQLGISIKTVEGQMTKALKILREQLATYLLEILILLLISIGY
ncbi:MAG: RNA polymerase sigma-70 factor [Reichenbachiella sp.]|uniref:RNA polymerase sigma-70 factor n=1 Tax=Reichenbachiella sp. TaxID=2184521 RepID=UPI003264D350